MNIAECFRIESMRGLRSLRVIIESLPPEAKSDGLDPFLLREEIESRLLFAGIEIITLGHADAADSACLYVNVNLIKTRVGLYAYSSRVALKQLVSLSRHPLLELYGTTWETSDVGTVGIYRLGEIIGRIGWQIDEFVTHFLEVNPRLIKSPIFLPANCWA